MAVTKIHPIKSTLKKALDYIENPAKTDEKMLVSSFACSYETADIEFELLLSQAMQKGNNLAHHLIQSFAPGETTPEQAHEIGRQLADEVLQGKYPYVLTTHIDKGHVHNHIIFCAVDMVNQRKYVSNRQSYAYIRRTSDRLCKEYGLSVVMPGQNRGKSYAEWDAHRKGASWKAKLKAAIDAAIPQAKDFDDFLRLLQEQGYKVKRGKYVSFRAPGQERFTRCKTLGETYTEEAIIERIKGRFVERKPKETRKISLRIDLENSIKAQQSAGYEKWAKLHNLKQAARTLNFLTEHEIESYPDLESRVAEITAASTEAAAALKAAERRLAEMAVLIKDVTTCKELHPLLQEYQRAADKKQFRRKHEGTLILYEAAAKALKEQGFQKLPDLYALKTEYKLLAEQKKHDYGNKSGSIKSRLEKNITFFDNDPISFVTHIVRARNYNNPTSQFNDIMLVSIPKEELEKNEAGIIMQRDLGIGLEDCLNPEYIKGFARIFVKDGRLEGLHSNPLYRNKSIEMDKNTIESLDVADWKNKFKSWYEQANTSKFEKIKNKVVEFLKGKSNKNKENSTEIER